MTWRWKITKTMSVGSRIRIEPAHSSGMSVPHWPWKAPERSGDRPLLRIVDEDEGEHELVPCPDRHQDPERDDGRRGQGNVDPPEEVPCPCAVDASGLGELLRHVDEVRPHPEHRERHVQADEREDDREPGVQDPQLPDDVVDRRDDRLERQRQPEDEQQEQQPRPRGSAGARSQSRPSSRSARAIGTTPRTIVRLETRSVPMLDWLNALTKLPHWGSAGHSSPAARTRTDGGPS